MIIIIYRWRAHRLKSVDIDRYIHGIMSCTYMYSEIIDAIVDASYAIGIFAE